MYSASIRFWLGRCACGYGPSIWAGPRTRWRRPIPSIWWIMPGRRQRGRRSGKCYLVVPLRRARCGATFPVRHWAAACWMWCRRRLSSDRRSVMDIGIMIEGQNGLSWPRWQAVLRAAEDLGFQCVFRSDHFTNPNPPDLDSLELWTSLTYAASHTERIEFGPLVTPVTFRHPAINARVAAAVDDLSNGRLVLGLGAGWQDREHHNFGVPFPPANTRLEMLAEYVQVVEVLLRSDPPSCFEGRHYTLDDAILLPRPRRPGGPKILIGGNGKTRTLPIAARYAD